MRPLSVSGLARLGFQEPEAVVADLEALGAWPARAAAGSPRLLGELAACANPDLAVRALAAIAAAHPDRDAFTAGLRRRVGLRRRLIALVAASRSLGRWLVAHPEEADRLADGRAFATARPRDDLVREALAVVRCQRLQQAWSALRRFKRRELLRIAVRDLAGGAPVDTVGVELADLADACLEAGLELAAGTVSAGRAADAPPGTGLPLRLAVLGMGKLGGAELNYVSDIDVLFCHEPAGGADPELAGRLAAAVGRQLMAGLGAVAPEGPGFLVDTNLRPEGRNGPLSRTLASYLTYWDRWAQPWELQALIKVRPAAGDRDLAERFCAEAAARVYPQRLDPEAIAAIRHTKARVESSRQARAGGDRQVKLGPGGLRDIEFAVQLLQLVHGRQDRQLRSGTTLVALERLSAAGFVGRADAAQLAQAYRFLRNVEHRLQLADERRTHTIPASEAERHWLARTMSYRDDPEASALERFEADRRRHAVTVRGIHEKLFYRPLLEVFGALPSDLRPEPAAERLAALGFANPNRALAHLHALTGGLTRRATLLRAMLPVMLGWLAETPDPDGGLAALRLVAERLGHRDAFFGTLRDNPAVAELLCTVLGTSRLLGDLLARHPELLTAMAHEGGPAAPRDPGELLEEALALVGRHQRAEAAWDALRRFRRRELLRVAVRDLAGGVPVERVGAELVGVAEACLEAGLQVARRTVAAAMAGAGTGAEPALRLAVLGMGKLGGAELNYVSDLDVLVCHEALDGTSAELAGRAASAMVRELLSGLGGVTPEGTGFRVDLGLRPEGRNGPLSRTLASYGAYWDRWAQPWELQALTKARPVAGDRGLAGRFLAAAAARVYRERLDATTVAAVRSMKARVESERLPAGADPRLHLKLGPGGLADVEWTVQLLQLRLGGRHPRVRLPGTLPALDALVEVGGLQAGEAGWLGDAYRLCLRLRNIGYLVAGRPADSLPTDPRALERLAEAMGEPAPGRQRLLEAYRRATRRARRVVMARFWGDRP
ncbi:MAG TPA: bifunctional [glutamine synthetase] adenylyltransferase/[glutamine synthetase]-adenylyl-L-tyrosine phosphorylase [Actinomycetes bacterium]|nr:bifunctional [glutamine synthetase] adenylyltransferase/[glutamine synthetase]-adenylyl-L-tyrosine phosphorylase [Actinomycetes bacterium]